MNEGSESLMTTVPAGNDPLELIQPCEQPLDLPTAPVTTQGASILRGRALPVAPVRSDQFNTSGSELLIERITVIGAIPNKSLGSSDGEGLIERCLDKSDLMWRSRSRVHGEWKTSSVCNNHELRTFAPLGLSDFRPPFFATVKVPSMKHSDRSIPPRLSKSWAKASSMCRITPLSTQRENRRKQVDPEGNRSGRSPQVAPVRSTQSTPLSTARSVCFSGRPLPSARRFNFGIRGSRIAHCSLVSSSRRLMPRDYAHPRSGYPSNTHVTSFHL